MNGSPLPLTRDAVHSRKIAARTISSSQAKRPARSRSNALRGSEHLRTVAGWKKLIERSGCGIEDCYVCGHGGSAVFTVKRKE